MSIKNKMLPNWQPGKSADKLRHPKLCNDIDTRTHAHFNNGMELLNRSDLGTSADESERMQLRDAEENPKRGNARRDAQALDQATPCASKLGPI